MMPARRIRILHIIQNLNYGGMERLLAEIVRAVDPTRYESHVLALQYLGRFAQGLEAHATLRVAAPMTSLSMVHPTSLIRTIRRIGPDVVHTHSGVWYKGTLAARAAGTPLLVHTEHGRPRPDPWVDRLLDGIAARRTDAVVGVSGSVAEYLERRLRVPRSRLVVITNGVSTACHRPAMPKVDVLQRLDLPAGPPVLGSVGRLEPVKGYEVMLEAYARLAADWTGGPLPVLALVGEGSERPRLERFIADRGLGNGVRLLGWRDDVDAFLSVCSLYTMSSHSEGTSVGLLEAMSSGLCPVVTDVGGNAAVLGPALRHRLVPPNDPSALAVAWRQALTLDVARRRDGQVARARVLEKFGLEPMVRAYQDLYDSARLATPRDGHTDTHRSMAVSST